MAQHSITRSNWQRGLDFLGIAKAVALLTHDHGPCHRLEPDTVGTKHHPEENICAHRLDDRQFNRKIEGADMTNL